MWISITTIFQYLFGVILLTVAAVLLKPILFPKIITFPWNHAKNGDDDDQLKPEDRTVILAGSYNPPHLGHMAMLEYLSKSYKTVIAVVGFNPNKKYAVTPEQRKTLLIEMIKTTGRTNIRVEVVEGYIWRYAKRQDATLFFRGIRSWEKDGADERALQILNTWGPLLLGPLVWPIPTLYLEGNPKYNHVSSTLIRDLCKQQQEQKDDSTKNDDKTRESVSENNQLEQLTQFVPENVVDMISDMYGKKVD